MLIYILKCLIESKIRSCNKKRGNSGQIIRKLEELFCTRGTDNELTNYVSFYKCLQRIMFPVERGKTKDRNNELKLRKLKDTPH